MNIRNIKQADIVVATGIGKSSISTYLSGAYEPKQKNIYKIAKALNVSESWLMGFDVPMDREENSNENNQYYYDDEVSDMAQDLFENPDYRALFKASRNLSKQDLLTVKALIESLTNK